MSRHSERWRSSVCTQRDSRADGNLVHPELFPTCLYTFPGEWLSSCLSGHNTNRWGSWRLLPVNSMISVNLAATQRTKEAGLQLRYCVLLLKACSSFISEIYITYQGQSPQEAIKCSLPGIWKVCCSVLLYMFKVYSWDRLCVLLAGSDEPIGCNRSEFLSPAACLCSLEDLCSVLADQGKGRGFQMTGMLPSLSAVTRSQHVGLTLAPRLHHPQPTLISSLIRNIQKQQTGSESITTYVRNSCQMAAG